MTARFSKERLAKVLRAFADAGQPVRKVRLADGTEILAGGDLAESEAADAVHLDELMRKAMAGANDESPPRKRFGR